MSVVVSSVFGVKTRVARLWPVPVDDKLALSIGMCAHLSNSVETLELICNRRLYQSISKHVETLAVNGSEFVDILRQFCAVGCAPGGSGAPGGSIASTSKRGWFAEQAARIERALLCTLAEANVAAQWRRPAVRIACVLAFLSGNQVVDTLNAVLGEGSVVRSDARRCDDLQFSIGTEVPDPFELSELLDAVAGSVV